MFLNLWHLVIIGIGPGFTYKPSEAFSVFMSPATAQWVIVNDQRLADEGAFGVAAAEYDADGNKIKDGELVKFQFGAAVKCISRKILLKILTLKLL